MIVLLHPRSTRPKNRRFPLAILSVAAVLEGREDYVVIDGNLDPDPGATLDQVMRQGGVELLAVSVMPGPQMVAAIPLCRDFRTKYPAVPIVWGGYFPSVYPEAALRAGLRGLRRAWSRRRHVLRDHRCSAGRGRPSDDQGPFLQERRGSASAQPGTAPAVAG